MEEETVFRWLVRDEPDLLQDALHDGTVAMGLFRWLPSASQHVVLQMLCAPDNLPATPVVERVLKSNPDALFAAKRLHILQQRGSTYCLNSAFRQGLTRGVANDAMYAPPKKRKIKIVKEGQQAANRGSFGTEDGVTQWERVLRLLLPDGEPGEDMTQHKANFVSAGYLDQGNLTVKGFQFLMRPTPAQVWCALQIWLAQTLKISGFDEKRKKNLRSLLARTVLSLAFHPLGVWYTPESEPVLKQLAHFGVVFYDLGQNKYKVTPLGKSLTDPSGSTLQEEDIVCDGDVIVETNNKVYVYTSDVFKTKVLSLFVDIDFVTEGMTVGRLTRDSLQRAFSKDITAEQVIAYLDSRAHPEMRRQGKRGKPASYLPDTVVDQFVSWETELRRVSFTPAVLCSSLNPGIISQVRSVMTTMADGDRDVVLHASRNDLVLTPTLYEKSKHLVA